MEHACPLLQEGPRRPVSVLCCQEGRDFLSLQHLRQLRCLSINAAMRPETFVEGIASLRMLSSLTHLELHAVAPPPGPRKGLHIC